MEMNEIELKNNDIYFMEVLDNIIVINDNYEGILFFNNKFEQIGSMKIMDDLSIYSSFKNGHQIILYCPDNGYLIHINIDLYEYKIIPLLEFNHFMFSEIYDWNKDGLILSDYQGLFVKVNINENIINEIDLKNTRIKSVKEIYDKLSDFKICKVNVQEKKAIVQISNSIYALVEYKNFIKILEEFEKEDYHDFEISKEFWAKIGEKKVEVLFKNQKIELYPTNNYIFLRGRFMIMNEVVYLFLLCGNKAETDNVILKCYQF